MLSAVRTLLIIFFAITTSGSTEFNMLIISLISCALLIANTHGAYRKWPCNYLESFFYVQLIVYAVSITYARHTIGSTVAVEGTSFGITLIVFIFVLGYHIQTRITSYKKYYYRLKGYGDIEEEEISFNQERLGRLGAGQ